MEQSGSITEIFLTWEAWEGESVQDNKLLTRTQYDIWLKSIPENTCTFCKYEKYQVIIRDGYEWVWIANMAPYWKRHTMLIPKRHFEDYGEMTNSEAVELKQLIHVATEKYEKAGYDRFIHFWRRRINNIDPKTGKRKFSHFHVHLCDDFDGLWDPILDKDACDWDVEVFK